MSSEKKRIGARLREIRTARHMTVEALAEAFRDAAGERDRQHMPKLEDVRRQIRGYEAGEHVPRGRNRMLYCAVFETAESELFGADKGAQIVRTPMADRDDGDRRRLLACLALLGVETATRSKSLEPIRRSLASVLPGGAQGHLVRDWEEVAFEHGHAFLTTPPDVLLPDLAADLVVLLESIRSADGATVRQDLCAPGGKMAALMAMTVATLGERRHARDWWKTARHTADASKDRGLRVWVRGYEAMNALYSKRPVSVVLRLADEAIEIAGDATGAEVLEAMASRTQALAMMDGRGSEAEDALHALEERFTRLPLAAPDDRLATGSWPETALHHTAAFTYTHAGNSVQAERARTAALSIYPKSMRRQRAQIELLRATSLVKDGDVLTGLECAVQTVKALAADQRTTTIQRGARMVLDMVPDAQMSQPAVRDYCDALVLPSARQE